MDSKERAIERAEADLRLSAIRAAAFLNFMLAAGRIPAHHVSHAREITTQYTKHYNAYLAALDAALPTLEVDRG